MKTKLLSLLAPYFYPQFIFTKEIKRRLDKTQKRTLIDCPCGNGETSYNLAKLKNLQVSAYDLDENSINHANAIFKKSNLTFASGDIHSVLKKTPSFYYYTLINSLFLLPDQQTILKTIYQKLELEGRLFIIVPNVEGKNYKIFKQNPANAGINTLELSEKEFEPYFSTFGFKIQSVKAIVYTANYGRKELKFLSVFSHLYLLLLHQIQSLKNKQSGNYFLIVLSKSK